MYEKTQSSMSNILMFSSLFPQPENKSIRKGVFKFPAKQ